MQGIAFYRDVPSLHTRPVGGIIGLRRTHIAALCVEIDDVEECDRVDQLPILVSHLHKTARQPTTGANPSSRKFACTESSFCTRMGQIGKVASL